MDNLILLLGVVLFVIAAYGDVKTLRIPNWLVGTVAALGVVRLIVIGDPTVALYTTCASIIIFVVTFLLFWRGLIGGGDAKLMTATVLLIGYYSVFNFLLLMSICGLLVSTAILVKHRSFEHPQSKARLAVPYGTAIAGGAIVTLLFQTSFLG